MKPKSKTTRSVTRTTKLQDAVESKGELKLGHPVVGSKWPSLEVHVEAGQDPINGAKYLGVGFKLSKPILWMLVLVGALLYGRITHDSTIVKKVFNVARGLLK